jgi:hypothetical protein
MHFTSTCAGKDPQSRQKTQIANMVYNTWRASSTYGCTVLVVEKGLHNGGNPQLSQVCVRLQRIGKMEEPRPKDAKTYLTTPHEDNGLARDVAHGQSSADLDSLIYELIHTPKACSEPTLSSTVSHFVNNMPSIPRLRPAPAADEKSFSARSNFES